METLANHGSSTFRDGPIAFSEHSDLDGTSPTDVSYDTIEIEQDATEREPSDTTCAPVSQNLIKKSQRASDLGTFFSEQGLGVVRPQLRLVQMLNRWPPLETGARVPLFLDMARSIFEDLFSRMRANPWVLWLLSREYDGFHYVKAQDKSADTFFFGFYCGVLIWTFEPATAFTRVLLIARCYTRREEICDSLARWAQHLSTPYVPLIAAALYTMLELDGSLRTYVDQLIKVERATGVSAFSPSHLKSKLDVDGLAGWSRIGSKVQINVIDIISHHNNCMRALDTIRTTYETKGASITSPDAKYREDYDKSMMQILESLHVLKMRADSFVSYATYIKNRAEAQISVIFALLTHEDSLSNLKAAQASMDIAAAAKRDSSAMKTVAFMTMAFLPATFLAAFFALPVLEWETKSSVQMDGFMLYWIVTLPATAMVFVLWILITKKNWILEQILKHRKGSSWREKKKNSCEPVGAGSSDGRGE